MQDMGTIRSNRSSYYFGQVLLQHLNLDTSAKLFFSAFFKALEQALFLLG